MNESHPETILKVHLEIFHIKYDTGQIYFLESPHPPLPHGGAGPIVQRWICNNRLRLQVTLASQHTKEIVIKRLLAWRAPPSTMPWANRFSNTTLR